MPKEAKSHEDEDSREQMEWDRLQNEALAAQRYRLEQEMEQARAQGLISEEIPGQDSFMGINWNSKWVFLGVAGVIAVGLVSVILLI